MKRILLALLALTFSLLACARSFSAAPASSDSTRTLTVDGIERTYIVHIPSSYNGSYPIPFVLDFHGGGHAWPGGDQPTQTISATKIMWDFFAAHPKP